MLNLRLVSMIGFASLLLGSNVQAYLGGFEEGDGYQDGGAAPMRDVSSYNAGQYGTNNGGPGGSFTNITPNSGLFYKSDVGRIDDDYGELVAHHGLAHSGAAGLVLRSTSGFGDTGNDGADYRYYFDSRDFNGGTPGAVTTGTIDIDYWACPQTAFFAVGRVTTTEFFNAAGETVFALGTQGQGALTAQPLIEWYDASGWHTTSIVGNNAAWDRVTLSFNMDTDTIDFTYFESLTNTTHYVITGAIADKPMTSLAGIRFTSAPNTEKNAYDDFAITASAVPEPSSLLLMLAASVPTLMCRRRRAPRRA
jgi:hypothetical protein